VENELGFEGLSIAGFRCSFFLSCWMCQHYQHSFVSFSYNMLHREMYFVVRVCVFVCACVCVCVACMYVCVCVCMCMCM